MLRSTDPAMVIGTHQTSGAPEIQPATRVVMKTVSKNTELTLGVIVGIGNQAMLIIKIIVAAGFLIVPNQIGGRDYSLVRILGGKRIISLITNEMK